MKKLIELVINEDALMELGVDAIALVENPAIEENFLYFKKEEFVEPRTGEDEGDFINRCMSAIESEFPDGDQRLAVCYTYWKGNAEFQDLEDACTPGYEAIGLKPKGGRMVPNCVPVKSAAQKFESYNDYPESATNAAKRALKWRDENPDQKCGTPVGWARANQLAKGENISEETIARMASFARHLQYKDVPYSEGCGGLMVDAWGGQAGIEWASNKLESIREGMSDEQFMLELEPGEINVFGYNTRNFKLCPGAINLFQHLMEMQPDEETIGMIRSAALQADLVFEIEQNAIDNEIATKGDLYEATLFTEDFIDLMKEIDAILGMDHDVSFMMGHLERIADLIPEEDFEIDTAGLPVYRDELPKKKFAENPNGYTRQQIIEIYNDPKERNIRKDRTSVYKYERKAEPSTSENRAWCRGMENDRFYFYRDIMALEGENTTFGPGGTAGYNKFRWQGGPNCIHAWKEYRYNTSSNDIEEMSWARGKAGQANHDDAPLYGYMSKESKRKSTVAYIIKKQGLSSEYYFNEDKRIVTGPLMIPNMEIPRRAEDGSKYYVYFTEETIRQIAEKFVREKKVDRTNIEHDSEDIRDQNYLFETWIVEDPEMDKAKALGFNVPKGTWMGSMRVMDDTTWNMVKEGKIKGFSVEGFFGEMSPAKEDEDLYNDIVNLMRQWDGR